MKFENPDKSDLTTYFPPPVKQGLCKTAFLAVIFAEIPVDSIWLLAN
jgi:hypothetical protein